MERIYCKHFKKETLSVLICKKSLLIILVFDMEIIILDSNRPDFKKLDKKLTFNAGISSAKLSYNEEMLAVALNPN